MLARLWWKEYRVFGPVWLVLGLAAGLLQWLFLSVDRTDWRSGGLSVTALCWAVLYAFAAGAAAFAGERESKTLGFLDALPVGRGKLWLGKASFAIASTFGLALLLAGLAALGTEARDPVERYSYSDLIRVFGTLLFEAVAWSLLWSALSSNPLLAGVMGVLSVYGSAVVIERLAAPGHLLASNDLVAPEVVLPRLLAAVAALVISGLVMAWRPKPRPASERRPPMAPAPVAIRASSTGRSLAWQATREGWTTWLLMALVGVSILVGSAILSARFDEGLDLVLIALASLVAGVSVFGTDGASGDRRFLVHHGVSPGSVWWRRLLVWGLAMGPIFGLLALSQLSIWGTADDRNQQPGGPLQRVGLVAVAYVNAFTVGLLCGMTIRRRITAGLVGLIGVLVLIPLQIALVAGFMVPYWSLAFVPLILLGVTRAWAGDWLMEREGARPWLRLGALIIVPFGMLGVGFVAYRAYGISDIGPQFVAANLQEPAPSPDQDAAEVYRRAASTIQDLFPAQKGTEAPAIEAMIEAGWAQNLPAKPKVLPYLNENHAVIALARQASALPRARFESLGQMTVASGPMMGLRNLDKIHQLLALDARDRLANGDRPAAWGDILALFRMAGQLGASSPPLARLTLSAHVHHRAVGLAFDWLAAPGLTKEEVGRALADLKGLAEPPDVAPAMMAEAAIIEQSLNLSGEELAEALLPSLYGRRPSGAELAWFARAVAAPWERQRARRVCRLLIGRELPQARLEPHARASWSYARFYDDLFQGSSLARSILPNFQGPIRLLDQELVGRRALVQAVAIEAWKLEHQGEYPETLQALVPGLLPQLPLDPYSGRPFGYVRSEGQQVRPPILPLNDSQDRLRPTRPGQPLIYSVGVNRTDEGGRIFPSSQFGDEVYPIP